MHGMIFDIQRASFHDGPGIRTTVFLKGCPLRCQWCHNPESWSFEQEVFYNHDGTTQVVGKHYTVDEVMAEVVADRAYYESSGGGVTLSGGEPMAQFPFSLALLKECKAQGIHTCMETCGHAPTDRYKAILPHVDLFLFDYKATGPDHKRYTGVGQELILANLEVLYEAGAEIILRCPLIPGINDSQEHFQAIAQLEKKYPRLRGIEIMVYHNLGNDKAKRLRRDPALPGLPNPSKETSQAWLDALRELGCEKVKIG
ncbi:MAG TPA: glycyl-radical enzyme activating protein [Firmicutes bacterium]|nr:glycyl-radical enzyme activating protein [Bacillota bacterium]